MKKLLLIFVFVIPSIFLQAQTPNQPTETSQEETQALIQKIDSLEHEISYLRLTYELYTLNTDITMFSDEVYTKSIAIQLDIYNRNLNSRLGKLYQQYYESCLHKKQSFERLIEAKKKYFALKIMTYPYTENELSTLMASYNVIDDAYDTLKTSMDMLKITIAAYKDLM